MANKSPADSHRSFGSPEFVARIQARQPDALEAVARAYLDQIFRAARGSGLDEQRAEDVTQATFTTFVETAHRFEGRSHVRTWLFGILYHKIAESRRERQRDDRQDDIDETVESRFDTQGGWARPPRAADLELEEDEIRERIEYCLETVPTRQRLAFVLKEVEGMNGREICNVLDVTITNLGVLLYRVRNRLRECLEKLGVKR